MSKRLKKAPMEASPSPSSYPVGEEARARWKHQSLMQDYQELMKETEAKKMKLQKTIQKKFKLQAEVKFLKKKYKILSKNPTQETQCRLKKQSRKIQSVVGIARPPRPPPNQVTQSELTLKDGRLARPPRPPRNQVTQSEFTLKDGRNHRLKEALAPSTSRLLDLNQISFPSSEEMQEFQVEWEPLEVEKLKRDTMDEEAVTNDLKLSICRGAGNNATHVAKRKISWQDQVALRV